jgi:hypothetical protein
MALAMALLVSRPMFRFRSCVDALPPEQQASQGARASVAAAEAATTLESSSNFEAATTNSIGYR